MSLENRQFLFLQGPHGPFFGELAEHLEQNGASPSRIAFNAGDRFYWPKKLPLTSFQSEVENWPEFINTYLDEHQITDLVLYAESRPIHAIAIQAARARGITTHFFEEGYLRPYWISYEREGVNGHSPLMQMSIEEIRARRALHHVNEDPAPAAWGNIWHHNWYGFTYHFQLWAGRKSFPRYRPHRNISLLKEWRLNATRLFMWPYRVAERDLLTSLYLRKDPHFYVVLLQLDHDASLKVHSDYETQKDYIDEVISAYARSAPPDLDLVFKLHPLEDHRVPITKWIKQSAKAHGVSARVKTFFGGKLGELLDHAAGAVTVNSTSAQQVLWRNLPLKISGHSVFEKPEFVFKGDLDAFFAEPRKPDHKAFLEYRSYLLETSQIPGGFYNKKNRKAILAHILPLLVANSHPYDIEATKIPNKNLT